MTIQEATIKAAKTQNSKLAGRIFAKLASRPMDIDIAVQAIVQASYSDFSSEMVQWIEGTLEDWRCDFE